jgi:signal peptidase I
MTRIIAGRAFPRPVLRRKSRLRELLNLLFFLVAVYALLEMTAPRSMVLSISMQPNLIEGQRLLISRVSYMFSKPKRGEIVVFEPNDYTPDEDRLIKRLIGLPGEKIEFRNQAVYINGNKLVEPYLNEPCEKAYCPDKSWTMGSDEYFFMGDNRNHSRDSRAFGAIKRKQIVGQAVLRWWPPAKWGILSYNYGETGTSSP